MPNPNMIGGGRMTRAEISGDKRRFEGNTLSRGTLLLRLWRSIPRLSFWRHWKEHRPFAM